MQPQIQEIGAKNLIGKKLRMNLKENRTTELWQSFMPRRSEIKRKVGDKLISLQHMQPNVPREAFTPETEFEKWAAVEVSEVEDIPEDMEYFSLNGGLYAVFIHEGPASSFPETARYIYDEWLPSSTFELDQRPHFEILTENYHPQDPNAREEVWVPIKAIISQ